MPGERMSERHCKAMSSTLINPNPTVYAPVDAVVRQTTAADDDEDAVDEIDSLEVFGTSNLLTQKTAAKKRADPKTYINQTLLRGCPISVVQRSSGTSTTRSTR
jgi:hypothetical protein